MGLTWSKRHHSHPHPHAHPHYHHPQPPLPPPPPPPPAGQQLPLPQAPSSSTPPTPVPVSFAFAANSPHPNMLPPPPPPPPPPPQPYYNYNYNYSRPPVNMVGAHHQPHRNYHNPYYGNGWFRPPPAMMMPMPPAVQVLSPAPYVDHQSAKKIKNDMNVHKDTIRLEVDEGNPDCHLVSFTFDAMVDGSILFCKGRDQLFIFPVYPDMYMPVKIPFQKGLGQKFCQPSGSGIDLGFFDIDDLSKPSVGDVFPLVICAESCLPSTAMQEESNGEQVNTSPHAQITQAVIEKNNEGNFQVKVIKQILWIEEVRYELREIYGISNSDEIAINDKDSGKECVICMTEPKDTAVLPCRHMCMCSECAKELRLQSNKCPICRQPIEELLEIKVDEAES